LAWLVVLLPSAWCRGAAMCGVCAKKKWLSFNWNSKHGYGDLIVKGLDFIDSSCYIFIKCIRYLQKIVCHIPRIDSTSPLWKNDGTPDAYSAMFAGSRWNGSPHATHEMATFIAKAIIIGKPVIHWGQRLKLRLGVSAMSWLLLIR